MGTPYIQFCDKIANLTSEEEAWWQRVLDEVEEDTDGEGFHAEFCTLETGERCLVISEAEEQENLRRAVKLVKQFLQTFRPDDCWAIEWANNVTRRCVGAYGGGAYFVTAKQIKRIWSSDWLEKQRKAFAKAKARTPGE